MNHTFRDDPGAEMSPREDRGSKQLRQDTAPDAEDFSDLEDVPEEESLDDAGWDGLADEPAEEVVDAGTEYADMLDRSVDGGAGVSDPSRDVVDDAADDAGLADRSVDGGAGISDLIHDTVDDAADPAGHVDKSADGGAGVSGLVDVILHEAAVCTGLPYAGLIVDCVSDLASAAIDASKDASDDVGSFEDGSFM